MELEANFFSETIVMNTNRSNIYAGNMRECFSHREPPAGGSLLPYDINTGTKSAACGLVCSEACDV